MKNELESRIKSIKETLRGPSQLEIYGPATVELFNAEKSTTLPKEIVRNPALQHQSHQRQTLHRQLSEIYQALPQMSTPLLQAVRDRRISPHFAASFYANLSEFLETDEHNSRIVLYLPFELLPDLKHQRTPDRALASAERKLTSSLREAWFRLLSESDVRANFVDGDVLEPGLGKPIRVRKAAHLIPVLLEKGIVTESEIIRLLNSHPDKELKESLTEGLAAAKSWQTGQQEPISKRAENVSLSKLLGSLQATLSDIDSRYSQRSPHIASWSKERVIWERQLKRDEALRTAASILAPLLAQEKLSQEAITSMLRGEKDSLEQQLAVLAVGQAGELGRDQSFVDGFVPDLTALWKSGMESLRKPLISLFNHWYHLGLVNQETLEKQAIPSPDLYNSVPVDVHKLIKEEFPQFATVVNRLNSDAVLRESFFPAVTLLGSRIKGYSIGSDLDAAVFIRPHVPWERRNEIITDLRKSLPEFEGLTKIAEFWTESKQGRLGLRQPDKDIFTIASPSQIHFILGSVWLGKGEDAQLVYQEMVRRSLDLSRFGKDKGQVRMHFLRRLEMDALQFRLMHKGYYLFHPDQRPRMANAHLVDGNSAFWDPGFRRIASLLFLTRVFLPDLSSDSSIHPSRVGILP